MVMRTSVEAIVVAVMVTVMKFKVVVAVLNR